MALKWLLCMKLTATLILVACLTASANGFSQHISIQVTGAPIEKVMEEISRQSGFEFLYTIKHLQKAKKIDLKVTNASLIEVLELCFKDQPLTYKIIDKTIVVQPRDQLPNAAATAPDISLIDVKGRITSESGEAVAASVQVKGTNKGTTTDMNGEFVLPAIQPNATLRITGVGIEPIEEKVAGRTNLHLVAKRKVDALQEVIIRKGYYDEKKSLSTGNTASVSARELEQQPVTNPLLALQGRVTGLSVIQPSGLSGSAVRVRIQGQNSIANGNNPLYVVDGVPVISELPMTGIDGILGPTGPQFSGNGSPLNFINMADIESIDILKDADATAIFGSLAANGAILITTKKGKAGKMKLELNLESGWGKVARQVDMLDTRQYLDMRYEAFRNDGIDWRNPSVSADDLKVWDTTRHTNWQKELIGNTAKFQQLSLGVSGGTELVRYRLGGTYQRQTTVFPIPDEFADTKASMMVSLDANSPDKKISIRFTGNYLYDNNRLPGFDLTNTALLLEPHAPDLLNPDGSLNWAPNAAGVSTFHTNPMLLMLHRYRNQTYNLISNLVLGYRLGKHLELRTNVGYSHMQTTDFRATPITMFAPERRSLSQRSAEYGNRNMQSWILEPQVQYQRRMGKGHLDILGGMTMRAVKSSSGNVRGEGHLIDELLENLGAAALVTSGYTYQSDYRYAAFFARVNYNWDEKYVLNLTGRRDGSSRFGNANRFSNFGAAGAAWIFSKEKFIYDRLSFLSFGKLRASYGLVGNDQIGDYRYLSLYDFSNVQAPYQGVVAIAPSVLPNPHIQWEETRKLQVGLDLGFWADRVVISANYARNRSSNQLLNYSLPTMSGRSSFLTNFPATVQNISWEFAINTDNIRGAGVNWSTYLNLTLPENTLLAFPGLETSTYANSLVIGEPVGVRRLYRFSHVDPATGRYLFITSDGSLKPSITSDIDRNRLVHTQEDFYGGLGNTFSYKGFRLDFLFQFVKQMGYEDLRFGSPDKRTPGSFYPGKSNQPVSVLDRWQLSGEHAPVAKFTTAHDFGGTVISSDYRFTDASFIRLKNVALFWDAPQRWLKQVKISHARLYVNAQNLLTLTRFAGLDPENQSVISLPPLRMITAGMQVSF